MATNEQKKLVRKLPTKAKIAEWIEQARKLPRIINASWILSEMSQKCALCGAEYPSGGSHRERFDLCLAKEFENPTSWGAAHHLTVACYMLQHNAYSREVWLEARKMLAQFIQGGVTPAAIRKRNRSRFDSGHRTCSVTKGAKLSEFDTIVWSRTIADVRLDNPETYCADVQIWAISVLRDTDALVRKLNNKS